VVPLDTPRKPSISRLIFADYASLLCFLFPLISWGMFAAAALGIWRSEPGEAELKVRFCFWSAIVATVVCVPILYLRFRSVHSLLRHGIAIPAKLISVWFMKDRGRIDYEYTYEGRTYRGGMALTKSKRAAEFQQGQDITILIDPANPARSIVPDLFG
jgi:hypothetical protein